MFLRTASLALVTAALITPAHAESLEVNGQIGLLGEWELLWEPYTERATCLESGAATDMTDYGNEWRRAFRQPVRAPANSDSSSQRP